MSRVNYTKLGLFAVAGALALVIALGTVTFALGEETARYDVYFAESVQGLPLGAPVKFRGVTVGTVEEIDVAPDGRHVEVTTALLVDEVARIHLKAVDDRDQALCAELAPVGLTGTKVVQIDVFHVGLCTQPSNLPFAVRPQTLPSVPSTLETLENAMRKLADSMPRIADNLDALVDRVNRFVGDVDDQDNPATLADTLAQTNETLKRFDAKLGALDTAALSKQAGATLREIEATSAVVRRAIDQLERERGLLARLELASAAVGEAAVGFDENREDIAEALDEVSEAARAVRRLADTLERDPDMLLKGRAELEP